jgi:hypothetical protein
MLRQPTPGANQLGRGTLLARSRFFGGGILAPSLRREAL